MIEFRTILVPIDFSDHSEKALTTATALAQKFHARLHLLHCYQIHVGGVSPYGVALPANFDREVREAAERHLSDWAQKPRGAGLDVATTVTPIFASEAISNTAQEIGADLIVMGTRGLSGLKHVLLGSVTERTVRIAPCPVLTVKESDPS